MKNNLRHLIFETLKKTYTEATTIIDEWEFLILVNIEDGFIQYIPKSHKIFDLDEDFKKYLIAVIEREIKNKLGIEAKYNEKTAPAGWIFEFRLSDLKNLIEKILSK